MTKGCMACRAEGSAGRGGRDPSGATCLPRWKLKRFRAVHGSCVRRLGLRVVVHNIARGGVGLTRMNVSPQKQRAKPMEACVRTRGVAVVVGVIVIRGGVD
jgi:hypothetical protein